MPTSIATAYVELKYDESGLKKGEQQVSKSMIKALSPIQQSRAMARFWGSQERLARRFSVILGAVWLPMVAKGTIAIRKLYQSQTKEGAQLRKDWKEISSDLNKGMARIGHAIINTEIGGKSLINWAKVFSKWLNKISDQDLKRMIDQFKVLTYLLTGLKLYQYGAGLASKLYTARTGKLGLTPKIGSGEKGIMASNLAGGALGGIGGGVGAGAAVNRYVPSNRFLRMRGLEYRSAGGPPPGKTGTMFLGGGRGAAGGAGGMFSSMKAFGATIGKVLLSVGKLTALFSAFAIVFSVIIKLITASGTLSKAFETVGGWIVKLVKWFDWLTTVIARFLYQVSSVIGVLVYNLGKSLKNIVKDLWARRKNLWSGDKTISKEDAFAGTWSVADAWKEAGRAWDRKTITPLNDKLDKDVLDQFRGWLETLKELRSPTLGYTGQYVGVTEGVKFAQDVTKQWQEKMIDNAKEIKNINKEMEKQLKDLNITMDRVMKELATS